MTPICKTCDDVELPGSVCRPRVLGGEVFDLAAVVRITFDRRELQSRSARSQRKGFGA